MPDPVLQTALKEAREAAAILRTHQPPPEVVQANLKRGAKLIAEELERRERKR